MLIRCSRPKCSKLFFLCCEWQLAGESEVEIEYVRTIPRSPRITEAEIEKWEGAKISDKAIEAWKEGNACLSDGHYKAACMVFRATLEEMLRSQSWYDVTKTLGNNLQTSNSQMPNFIKTILMRTKDIGNWHSHLDFRADSITDSTLQDAETMKTMIEYTANKLFIDDYEIAQQLSAIKQTS